MGSVWLIDKPFPKRQILDSSEVREFADDNFKFDQNSRKLSEWVEQFFLFPQCFRRLVLQTRKNQGLFGKGLSVGLVAWRS